MKIIHRLLLPFGLKLDQTGILDFLLGFILVTAPWFFVGENNLNALATVMAIGSVLILYSIFTDYKHGIVWFIARKIHAALDLTLGVTLMAIWSIGYTITGLFLILIFCAGILMI